MSDELPPHPDDDEIAEVLASGDDNDAAPVTKKSAWYRVPRRRRRWPWFAMWVALLIVGVGGGLAVRYSAGPQEGVVAQELSDMQAEAQDAGFIAVPYVPPLAPGELVHVVHTQLQPAELASLGVNVDPTLTTDMPADILVGADGFPRAVRISEEISGEGGF